MKRKPYGKVDGMTYQLIYLYDIDRVKAEKT